MCKNKLMAKWFTRLRFNAFAQVVVVSNPVETCF